MHHTLNILPAYYDAVKSGDKRFEIRNNDDRGFQKGDTVCLKELYPGAIADRLSGRAIDVEITYVTNYEQKDGLVVFGFVLV